MSAGLSCEPWEQAGGKGKTDQTQEIPGWIKNQNVCNHSAELMEMGMLVTLGSLYLKALSYLTSFLSRIALLICTLREDASLVALLVKNRPAMQETLVWFLGQINHLEKGTATHSSILVFWPGEFHGLCSPWNHRVRHDWMTFTFKGGLKEKRIKWGNSLKVKVRFIVHGGILWRHKAPYNGAWRVYKNWRMSL